MIMNWKSASSVRKSGETLCRGNRYGIFRKEKSTFVFDCCNFQDMPFILKMI